MTSIDCFGEDVVGHIDHEVGNRVGIFGYVSILGQSTETLENASDEASRAHHSFHEDRKEGELTAESYEDYLVKMNGLSDSIVAEIDDILQEGVDDEDNYKKIRQAAFAMGKVTEIGKNCFKHSSQANETIETSEMGEILEPAAEDVNYNGNADQELRADHRAQFGPLTVLTDTRKHTDSADLFVDVIEAETLHEETGLDPDLNDSDYIAFNIADNGPGTDEIGDGNGGTDIFDWLEDELDIVREVYENGTPEWEEMAEYMRSSTGVEDVGFSQTLYLPKMSEGFYNRLSERARSGV